MENKSGYAEEEPIDLFKSHEDQSQSNYQKQRIQFEKLLKENDAREHKVLYELEFGK